MRKLLPLLFALVATQLIAQPVINKNPISQTLCLDTCGHLIVSATGLGFETYVYQWQEDEGAGFVNMTFPGNGSDTLNLCGDFAVPPASISYRCIVFDTNGASDTSKTAVVTYDSCSLPVADFTIEFAGATERCFTNASRHANSITWSFGDGVTDDSETPCHTYDSQWIFDVKLYAFNNYGSDEKTFTLDLLSVEELDHGIAIYPNPVLNELNIESSVRFENVRLIDVHGNELPLKASEYLGGYKYDMQSFPNGVYHLMLEADGRVMQRKILKL